MYYCYSIKSGLFDDEMLHAKDLGVYIFYDEEKDAFFDKDGNAIDIKGLKIFPRTGALQARRLVEAVARHGGDSLATIDDYDKTINWPNYYKTDRRNVIIKGADILDDPQRIIDLFGQESVFFKTKFKNYSNIIDVVKFVDKKDSFNKALEEHREDDFIISDVVEIIKDDFGSLEYRAFVVNGEVYNISRTHDRLLCSVPENVMEKLYSVVEKMSDTEFPKSYVVDLFVYEDICDRQAVDVLEFNPIVASGTYLYNTVFKRSDDLSHSEPESALPEEVYKYVPLEECGYDVVNENERSICYNMPGGFASDIMSFALFGEKSSGNMYFHISRSSDSNMFSDIPLDISGRQDISEDNELSDEKVFGESVSETTSVDDMIKMLNKKMSETMNKEESES